MKQCYSMSFAHQEVLVTVASLVINLRHDVDSKEQPPRPTVKIDSPNTNFECSSLLNN